MSLVNIRPIAVALRRRQSLSLMLTRERAGGEPAGVRSVFVDEWHELIASKRGVQVQLALARLKRWNPRPRSRRSRPANGAKPT